MMGLWADGWFYISSAGLLVSGILFFFLLGQYRVASEAADLTEDDQGADKEGSVASSAIRPVYIPGEIPAAQVVSHSLLEPEPKSGGEYSGPEGHKDSTSTTGGLSSAVVYLQNIKVELADLHKDLRSLAKRVDDDLGAVAARDEALIERLGELTRVVENMKVAESVTTDAPAPKKARKVEKAPEPAPAAAEPASPPQEPLHVELGLLVAAPPAQPEPAAPAAEPIAPAPAQAEPSPAVPVEQAPVSPEAPPEEKTRRGPVWPV